jgi:hypothetical protein
MGGVEAKTPRSHFNGLRGVFILLILLLFFLQFAFLFDIELGFLLLFLVAFIFLAGVAHEVSPF